MNPASHCWKFGGFVARGAGEGHDCHNTTALETHSSLDRRSRSGATTVESGGGGWRSSRQLQRRAGAA